MKQLEYQVRFGSSSTRLPVPDGIEVVYEDAGFVVVHKPPGLLSVPGRTPDKSDCVIARVKELYPNAQQPMTVHRLDMATSGLMLVALRAECQRSLSMAFQNREVQKRYAARLVEVLPEAWGTQGWISLPLAKDWIHRPKHKVCFEDGRMSLTRWTLSGASRKDLHLFPHTGRSHQLRIHCAEGFGIPIFGDRLYGPDPELPRLYLHAEVLGFRHPLTEAWISVERLADFDV